MASETMLNESEWNDRYDQGELEKVRESEEQLEINPASSASTKHWLWPCRARAQVERLQGSTPLFLPQVFTMKDNTTNFLYIVPIADTARTKAHAARIHFFFLSLSLLTGTNER